MTKEVIQPVETEFGVPITLWTEEELTEAFTEVHSSPALELLDEEGALTLPEKVIRIGEHQFNCSLTLFPPSFYSDYQSRRLYVPFPQRTRFEVPIGKNRAWINQFPVRFNVSYRGPYMEVREVELQDIANYFSYVLELPQITPLESASHPDGYDLFNVKVAGAAKNLILPGDPALLSQMRLTFTQKDQPPFQEKH